MRTLALIAMSIFIALSAGDFGDIDHAKLLEHIKKGDAVIIDVNGTDSYNKGHIPQAINFSDVKGKLAKVLPDDKSTPIIAYCSSPSCKAWKWAAKEAKAAGYTDVVHYSGGRAGWEKHEKSFETFASLTRKQVEMAIKNGATVVDVNGTDSFNKGHIDTAINYEEVSGKLVSKLPSDKDALIIAYCSGPSCKAWKYAAKEAKEAGYTNIAHFPHGLAGWKAGM